MIDRSKAVVQELFRRWENGSVREVLDYCQEQKLLRMPDRLLEHLRRQPRAEAYDEETFGQDKEDWLCDLFFSMKTTEVPSYYKFLSKNTVYSTQHGVKGEQYSDVLVVFDDVEAAWSQYSFTKLLTPETSGEPTEGQRERSRKLAYVCFSRAMENLRVLLFTPHPEAARQN